MTDGAELKKVEATPQMCRQILFLDGRMIHQYECCYMCGWKHDQVYVCVSVYVCVRPCVTEVSAANVFGLSSK